jgi:hypothetical protein
MGGVTVFSFAPFAHKRNGSHAAHRGVSPTGGEGIQTTIARGLWGAYLMTGSHFCKACNNPTATDFRNVNMSSHVGAGSLKCVTVFVLLHTLLTNGTVQMQPTEGVIPTQLHVRTVFNFFLSPLPLGGPEGGSGPMFSFRAPFLFKSFFRGMTALRMCYRRPRSL